MRSSLRDWKAWEKYLPDQEDSAYMPPLHPLTPQQGPRPLSKDFLKSTKDPVTLPEGHGT